MMTTILVALVAGAVGGYLFNVVVYRVIEGEWLFWPR